MLGAEDSQDLVKRWVVLGQVIRRQMRERNYEALVESQEVLAKNASAHAVIGESYIEP
jgi:hypothetical protein